jgi:hypothetical protein
MANSRSLLCPHVQWVDLDGLDRDWAIIYAHRFRTVVDELPDPKGQFPSIVFFVGKQEKRSALQSIFTNNNVNRRRGHGIGSLQCDVTTLGSRNPILIADCHPTAKCTNLIGSWNGCHASLRLPLHRSVSLSALIPRIQADLLFRFVDVVCIFTVDLGGCHAAIEMIQHWTDVQNDHGAGVKPRLVVVVATDSEGLEMACVEQHPGFALVFSGLTVVTTDCTSGLSDGLYLELKARLWSQVKEVRHQRQEDRILFSAAHLHHLFRMALSLFVRSPSTAFDWLLAARSAARSPRPNGDCLREFLSLTREAPFSSTNLPAFVASALLMNCYPAEMHREPLSRV